MKNIRFYRKWNILVYIGILCMLLACADHMLQGDGNSEANQQRKRGLRRTMLQLLQHELVAVKNGYTNLIGMKPKSIIKCSMR